MHVDLITLDIKLAMKEPGCPICRLRQRAERRYLLGILRENVNDSATRARISRSWGFCQKHAWQLQHLEEAIWHDGLGNAIIYQDLTQQVVSWLRSYVATPGNTHNGGLLWKVKGALKKAQPKGTGACPACSIGSQSERTYLEWLVRALSDEEFQALYRASDGLCLHHLQHALEIAEEEDPEAASILVEIAIEKLEELHENLEGYIAKHSWHRRSEVVTDAEESSWKRAVAFFSGEEHKQR
jgi:hypothetical protein